MAGAPRNKLAELILDVRYGRVRLAEPETTEGLEYSAQTATALIRASQNCNTEIPINLAGTIQGHLSIHGPIGGDLNIWGSISGDLNTSGSIDGEVFISGSVGGDLSISGSVGGDLFISGSVGGDLFISGSVGGHLYFADSISGDLDIWGTISDYLYIADSGLISGDFNIRSPGLGSINGGLYISGTVSGDLDIWGSISGPVDLLKAKELKVGSFSGASFAEPVFLGEGVDLYQCDFRGFSDFEQLRFFGSKLFGSNVRKRIAHTQDDETIPDVVLAGIYRELRKVYERQSNRPGAGDFYYQEMNARRRHAHRRRKWLEWFVLVIYWGVSGYGQSLWRAVSSFVAIAVVGAALFYYNGFAIETAVNIDGEKVSRFEEASPSKTFLFSLRSMVSFLSPPSADLGEGGQWLQMSLRFLGPTVLTQAILTIREKVAR